MLIKRMYIKVSIRAMIHRLGKGKIMNKIFKVIWSKTKNCYIAVSEVTKSHTKDKSKRGVTVEGGRLAISAAVLVVMLLTGGAPNVMAGDTHGGSGTNTAGGSYAVVNGGYKNSASAQYSTVDGGQSNQAKENTATVVGGFGNIASGQW